MPTVIALPISISITVTTWFICAPIDDTTGTEDEPRLLGIVGLKIEGENAGMEIAYYYRKAQDRNYHACGPRCTHSQRLQLRISETWVDSLSRYHLPLAEWLWKLVVIDDSAAAAQKRMWEPRKVLVIKFAFAQ